MAGVLYSRTVTNDGNVTTLLIGARTKLISTKSLQPRCKPANRMTIPRLEIRAVLMAAQLRRSFGSALNVPTTRCHLWSDSKIILHWLQSDGPVGNDLVDNISHIQDLASEVTRHHVSTADNPADIASRGTNSTKLADQTLWWRGPVWLAKFKEEWPTIIISADASEKSPVHLERYREQCLLTCSQPVIANHIERFSTLRALLRATPRSRRLLLRGTPGVAKPLDPLSAEELRGAFLICVKLLQRQTFSLEIDQLRQGKILQKNGTFRSLGLFLDDQGILRVGGRLNHSHLPYDEKHPVLIDGHAHIARLIITWAHEHSLHAGFRATHARVLQRAWITRGKVMIKRYLRKCMVYTRISARPSTQGMAPLPGDMSTVSFLGASTRFVGRRGRLSEIWSDNGTNFHGVDLELQRQLREAEFDWRLVEGQLAQDGISWRFIPQAAPHFGGLWEAGVKSMKTHLHRIASPRRLVYEEFATLLVSIETILNSRPLTPPTGDLGDLEALTPSHFLIGTSATLVPQPENLDTNLDQTHHWELVKAMRDRFWDRWSREYLNTLIHRPKWANPQPNLAVGGFVGIVNPSLLRPDGR